MEKKGVLLPIAVALIAAFIYWMVLTSKEQTISKSLETGQVIVARTDIPPRTVITPDLVDVVTVPRKYMQQDAYEVRSPSDIKLVSNLVTSIRILKGNQVTQNALISLSPKAGLSVKVPPGRRGCLLSVPNEWLKLVKPGDRIDVLVTFTAVTNDNRKEPVTATILQRVMVLGVGGDLGQGMTATDANKRKSEEAEVAGFSDKGVLSLALDPIEAEYLALSIKQGDVSIVVRSPGDVEIHPIPVVNFMKLFGKS